MPADFRLTEGHLKLLRRMNIGWDATEYGAPGASPKRPYGNSDVEADICSILGWQKEQPSGTLFDEPQWSAVQRQRAAAIHHETLRALQLLVVFAGESLKPGLYRLVREYDYRSWERVGD